MGALKLEYLPNYAYDEYYNWEGNWELIYGIPYAMSSPSLNHQFISGKIWRELEKKSKLCIFCKSFFEIDWKISENTVVSPDVVFVCGTDIGDKYLKIPPKIIFEILSPSTAKKDKTLKFNLYEEEKVNYYIIVNIKEKIAEVFELKNDKYDKVGDFSEKNYNFEFDEYNLNFDFNEIWI